MKVEVVEPGKVVRVGPGEPSAADVLEFADVLIQEEGWLQDASDQRKSSPENGWTLHDALGEANRRLYPNGRGEGGKDGIYLRSGRMTRDEAIDAVLNVLPSDPREKPKKKRGQPEPTPLSKWDDKAFNDTAASVDEVLDVLRKARQEVLGS